MSVVFDSIESIMIEVIVDQMTQSSHNKLIKTTILNLISNSIKLKLNFLLSSYTTNAFNKIYVQANKITSSYIKSQESALRAQ